MIFRFNFNRLPFYGKAHRVALSAKGEGTADDIFYFTSGHNSSATGQARRPPML